MRAAPVLLALLTALPAAASGFGELAQPRPLAVVEEPVVRLADLFDGLGPRGAAVLGPAPAPGARHVVEGAQLAAIARQHGIAFRPVAGADRVVIERPGRPLPMEEAMARLREALRPLGVDAEAEIELAGFVPPLVPSGGALDLFVEQAAVEAGGARFAATLGIAAEGLPTARLRLQGRIVQTVAMVVAARRLVLNEVVGPQDVRVVRVPASRLRPGAAQDPALVVGQQLRRPAAAEAPVMLADLARPAAVEKGATVTMLFESPGMTLTAQGRALEAAPRGAAVPVMNLVSRIVVEGQVIGPGRVRVGPGR